MRTVLATTGRRTTAEAWLSDEVAKLAHEQGHARVGLLASESTYARGTLRRHLAARALHCGLPSIAERRELVHADALLHDGDIESARYHLLAVAGSLSLREGLPLILVASPRYEKALAAPSAPLRPRILCGVQLLNSTVQLHWRSEISYDAPPHPCADEAQATTPGQGQAYRSG